MAKGGRAPGPGATDHAHVMANMGTMHCALGDLGTAHRLLDAAARDSPDDWYAQARLGEVLVALGSRYAARVPLAAAAELVPQDAPTELRLVGLLLLHAQWAARAVGLLERAAKLRPADPNGPAALAPAYIQLGQPWRAAELLERSVRRWPDAPGLGVLLGEAYLHAGAPQRAHDVFAPMALAAVSDDHFALATSGLGAALAELGRPRLALSVLSMAARLLPPTAPAYASTLARCGAACLLAGDLEHADRLLQVAVALQPTPYALSALGATRAYLGDAEGAERLLLYAAAAHPRCSVTLLRLAFAHGLRGNHVQRCEAHARATALLPCVVADMDRLLDTHAQDPAVALPAAHFALQRWGPARCPRARAVLSAAAADQ